MLLEMAVADAYGIAFEFVKDPVSHGLKNDLTFQQNPRYPELKSSQYTDDTLRSIATWQVIRSTATRNSPFNPESYAAEIMSAYRLDKRRGWSKRFQSYLEDCDRNRADARQFLTGIANRKTSNGSIMGCLPCGFLSHPVEVKLAATAQAIATHCSTTSIAAQTMALAAHYFIYDQGSPRELGMFLETQVDGFDPDYIGPAPRLSDLETPITMEAEHTGLAVLALLQHCTSLSEIMVEAVKLGGDTDSVAALAVGIASCSADYDNDIPAHLIEQLDEGGVWGEEHLRDLDAEMTRYAQKNGA